MDLQDLYNFVDFWSKRGDQPGTAPQITGLRDAMKDTGKIVDDYVLGGTYQANMRGQDELLKQLLINAALMGAGAGVGAGVGKGAKGLMSAYGKAKNSVNVGNVLIHGGSEVLEGGVINPSFVRGNTIELNNMQLGEIDNKLSAQLKNINFIKEQMAIPGSFANRNIEESISTISRLEQKLKDTKRWADIAKKENYFTGVQNADEAYAQSGAYHVINPPKQNVTTGFGPGGEFQIAGKQTPVKSFPTTGKTTEEINAMAKDVDAFANKLRQQQIKKEAVMQLFRNLRK